MRKKNQTVFEQPTTINDNNVFNFRRCVFLIELPHVVATIFGTCNARVFSRKHCAIDTTYLFYFYYAIRNRHFCSVEFRVIKEFYSGSCNLIRFVSGATTNILFRVFMNSGRVARNER